MRMYTLIPVVFLPSNDDDVPYRQIAVSGRQAWSDRVKFGSVVGNW